MWYRLVRDMSMRLYRVKHDLTRRWRLDTPAGSVGILTLMSGLLLLVVIEDGIANAFRAFIPWVYGSRIGEVYWQSIGFGIKFSFIFLLFSSLLILFILLKFSERR